LAWDVAASGAAGDLGDELEGAFFGSEVWDGERSVGAEDADEGDIWEIESFGDHLGAEHEFDVALTEAIEDGEII